MELNNVLSFILNHIQSDNLYIEALDIEDVNELEDFCADFSMDFLDVLDEAINMELSNLDIKSIVDSLDEMLKFNLVKHYIEEYDSKDDLNRSIVYYYIQYLFMLNLTDMVLREAFKDIVDNVKEMRNDLYERKEINILGILKKHNFQLPSKVYPTDNLEFNKGYLLCFMHTKLDYEEQFHVLNIMKNSTDSGWSVLLEAIYKEGLIRDSEWFVY